MTRPLSFHELWDEWAAATHLDARDGGLTTGWPRLDHPTEGLGKPMRPGEVVQVAARTNTGKSWALLAIAQHQLQTREDLELLSVSLEMLHPEVTERLVANRLGRPPIRIREELLAGTLQREKVLELCPELSRFHNYDKPTSLEGIKNLVEGMRYLGHNLGVVLVDYMGLVRVDMGGSQYERVSHVARELKGLAQELQVLVLCASQIKRFSERGGPFSEPTLTDLRDSGAIEEAADRVLMFWRSKPETKPGEVASKNIMGKIEKNRHGPVGARTELYFDRGLRLREVPIMEGEFA